jgi:large subunit ribosomal protein L2
MTLVQTKPTTPSQRHLLKIKRKHLQKSPFIKSKIKGMKKSSGRNNQGKITSYHKGSGHKQKYRKIDFDRTNDSIGIVTTIEYDPNRTANIASVYNIETKNYIYILAPKNLKIGDIVKSGSNAGPLLGHSLPISKIPVGSFIHNISPKKNKKAQISRAAGTFSYIIEKNS